MKTKVILMILSVIAASAFPGCNKSSIDLKGYTQVDTRSDILKTMGVHSFFYKELPNGYEVYWRALDKETRIIHTFNADVLGTSIVYADDTDQFSILAEEKNKKIQVSENGKLRLDLLYYPESRKFFNKVTGLPAVAEWRSESSLDSRKYLLAGALTDEVAVLKLYENPITKAKLQGYDQNRARKQMGERGSHKELFYESPCLALCRSDPNFSGGKTGACYEAKEENTNNCCISSICLGCCEHLGCDCYTLIGDYFGWCVALSKACSSS